MEIGDHSLRFHHAFCSSVGEIALHFGSKLITDDRSAPVALSLDLLIGMAVGHSVRCHLSADENFTSRKGGARLRCTRIASRRFFSPATPSELMLENKNPEDTRTSTGDQSGW